MSDQKVRFSFTVHLRPEDMDAITLAAMAHQMLVSDFIREFVEVRACEYRMGTPVFKAMVAEREAHPREERERKIKAEDFDEFAASRPPAKGDEYPHS